MAQPAQVTTLDTTNGAPPPGSTSVSADQAVQVWLQQHGVSSIDDLNSQQLNSLIAYLKSLQSSGQADSSVNKAIQELTQIKNQFNQAASTSDPVAAMQAQLEAKSKFGHFLIQHGDKSAETASAVTKTDSQISALQDVIDQMNSPDAPWNGGSGESAQAQIQSMIENINKLKEAGVDVQALGLDKFQAGLQTALNNYSAANHANHGDELVAQSQLASDATQAHKQYLLDHGANAGSPEVQQDQRVLDTESNWRRDLSLPWDEHTTPPPNGFKQQDLADYKKQLQADYIRAQKSGDAEAMKFISSKIDIVSRAMSNMAGVTNPDKLFNISLTMVLELKAADLGMLTVLINRYHDDPKKVSELQTQYDLVVDQMGALSKAIPGIGQSEQGVAAAVNQSF